MTIGCIFGSGDVPLKIIENISPSAIIWINETYHIKNLLNCNQITLQIGEIGRAIEFLKKNNVTNLIVVGKISRPSLLNLKLDKKGFDWFKQLSKYFFKGDDALLKKVNFLLEEEGFKLISSSSIVGFPKKGFLTQSNPTKLDNIDLGIKLLDTLSHFDIGQSCIVENFRVIGIEGPEGTDNLIRRCKKFITESAIIFKTSKTNQSQSLDIPTIGPKTIELLKDSKIKGIILKNTQIIDLDEVVNQCNKNNIFLYII